MISNICPPSIPIYMYDCCFHKSRDSESFIILNFVVLYSGVFKLYFMSLPCSASNHNTLNSVRTEKSREREIGMKHGGITGFEVKIGRDGGISEFCLGIFGHSLARTLASTQGCKHIPCHFIYIQIIQGIQKTTRAHHMSIILVPRAIFTRSLLKIRLWVRQSTKGRDLIGFSENCYILRPLDRARPSYRGGGTF